MPAERSLRLVAACTRVVVVAALALLPWTTPPDASAGAASSRAQRLAKPTERRLATIVDLPCPAGVPNVVGPSFKGQSLVNTNFNRRSLVNADFSGATLDGVVFIGADLRGANFSHATFLSSKPGLPNDFTLANLTDACFFNAKFPAGAAPTYFSHATVTSADFSSTDLSSGNVVLGPSPLAFDPAAPRPRFRNATVNCEFVGQWAALDFSGADISRCTKQLAGRDYSNAMMAGVTFGAAVLDGTLFVRADLSGAVLDDASLQCGPPIGGGANRCVDLSNAKLQGASFNRANLSGASLYSAFLSNNDNSSISDAASLRQAHLKNVNLSAAQLSGVDFTLANFYGDNPTNPGACATTGANYGGFTKGCASAHNANMAAATFVNAYLYGVDFTAAAISGANFDQAVLSGANFAGADVGTFAASGSRTKFTRAHLEGTNLDQAAKLDADLTDAFVDFRIGGNLFYVLLDGTNHNRFACSKASPCNPPTVQDVCVFVRYPKTTVPEASASLTCPDGTPAAPGGCGDARADNLRWKSSLVAGTPPDPGPPPAWYSNAPTYGSATDPKVRCRGGNPVTLW